MRASTAVPRLVLGAALAALAGGNSAATPTWIGDVATQVSSQAPRNPDAGRPSYGVEVEMVTLPVTIVSSHDPLGGVLTQEDFTVLDEGVEQDVAVLLKPGDTPLEVAVLLDLSSSMDPDAGTARQAVLSFLEQLAADDCVLYLPFADSIATAEWSTPDDPDLRARVLGSQMEGGTRLFDALVDSFYRVEQGEERCGALPTLKTPGATDAYRRRALVVVTDGFDAGSVLSFEHVLSTARQVETPVFPVAIGTITGDIHWLNLISAEPKWVGNTPWRARSQLRDLARATGGQYLEGGRSVEAVRAAYDDALRWLRSYYVLGYSGTTPTAGSADPELPVWHEIEVRLHRRGYEVHTRPGYYRSPTDRGQARYHIERGTRLASIDQPAEALLEFDLAVRADPYYWEAHYRRGGTLAMLGDMRAAQRAFLEAAELNPGRGEVQKMTSLSSRGIGDYSSAWNHAIRAHQAGVGMTAEMHALSLEAEPPSDLDAQLESPRIYVQRAFAADPVANVALARMLRTLSVVLSKQSGIGLTGNRELAQYVVILEPRNLRDDKPRKLEADMLLVSPEGEQVHQDHLMLSDIDNQAAVAAALAPWIDRIRGVLSDSGKDAHHP